MAEQFVGQELLCAGLSFEPQRLLYWQRESKNSNAEVDYLLACGEQIFPLEVKAGSGNTLRSVFQFLKEKRRQHAVRLSASLPSIEAIRPPGFDSEIHLLFLPLFLAGEVPRLLPQLPVTGKPVGKTIEPGSC